MKKSDIVEKILPHIESQPKNNKGLAFAPTNVALAKYWGNRDNELNLPFTASLSVALPDKGALISLILQDARDDIVILNGEALLNESPLVRRLLEYLVLFRQKNKWRLQINISLNFPLVAGLSSSACLFASYISALNDLFAWQLSRQHLSILARLGNGSASRSLWKGFVEWHAGISPDGMDSYGDALPLEFPSLDVGILSLSDIVKPISTHEAMQRTVDTSALYGNWSRKVLQDLIIIKQALYKQNFSLLGGTAESNALTMHATMLSSWPPICYFLPDTIAAMHKIWQLRKEGLPVFFTEDAGPNLKLLFLDKDKEDLVKQFPSLEVIKIFD